MRRVWAPVGKRPVARFKRGYKWTYLYGFVRPESGEVYWLILPTVNVELCSRWLSMSSQAWWERARTSAYFWWWIRLGGTPAKRSRSPKGYILSSCRQAHPSL